MAPRTTVTADTLVSLGAQRLAGILLDLAGEQPTIKRRLRLELAGQAGGEIIAAEISKRLTALRSARSFIDWQKRPDFVRDLNLTRTMIADRLAETRPDLALDLMWRFMALAEPTLNRVDDSSGSVGEVFRAACDDLGSLGDESQTRSEAAGRAGLRGRHEERVWRVRPLGLDDLPGTGRSGVAALRTRLAAELSSRPAKDGYDSQAAAIRRALQDLADGEGDVDAYIALVPAEARKRSDVAAKIGRRLLTAGRSEEAIKVLEAAAPRQQTRRGELGDDLDHLGWEGPDGEWESVYLDALDATGRPEDAQRIRWKAFEERLSVERLRAYLKALPDFEDVLAEQKAMEYALGFRSFSVALHFLHAWPEPRQADASCPCAPGRDRWEPLLSARPGGTLVGEHEPARGDAAATRDDRGHSRRC